MSKIAKMPEEPMDMARTAFQKAIQSGRLSIDRNSERYVGLYMYMGFNTALDSDCKDLFKHRYTREYLA